MSTVVNVTIVDGSQGVVRERVLVVAAPSFLEGKANLVGAIVVRSRSALGGNGVDRSQQAEEEERSN